MKLIICMFIVLISAKECDKNKAQLASQNNTEAIATGSSEKQMQNDSKITYLAVSRGYFLSVTLEGDSISFSNERDLKSPTAYKIPKEEKESLMNLISKLDAKTLPELEAPSKAHEYDGAAIATLEIADGEDSYKTVSFDHGNPPESIKAIVEKMLSIKTMIEKQ